MLKEMIDDIVAKKEKIVREMLSSIYTPSPAIKKLLAVAQKQEKDKLNG